MALQGKGFMIWKIPSCEGGNPAQIAATAKAAGLTHVLIKIADGPYAYNVDKETQVDLVPPVVEALKGKGIQVWGWHYVYGNNPVAEAQMAVKRVKGLNLSGYVIDAEEEYKLPGRAEVARTFMNELRKGLPQKPVALCSYRWPSYHPQLPWDAFLEKCDYNMPQVYWMSAHNPAAQLQRSVREFNAMRHVRPILPTGPVYREYGWEPTPAEIQEFLETCISLNLSAANFFAWDYGRTRLKPLWETIAAFQWGLPALPEKDLAERYISALNTRDAAEVIWLYEAGALHITARRTRQGAGAIQSWFSEFLTQKLPNAAFRLVSYTAINNVRHLSWTAASPSGLIQNGRDTFGIREGKISYHYSSFTITPAGGSSS